jgi:hypothetical protein
VERLPLGCQDQRKARRKQGFRLKIEPIEFLLKT